ncbi:MAG: hypothetical protein CYPHOPRED_003476 [Cyphobasidiales sp. Tagirdzhanova-0007]|nr:MAG: hypothetical protein CYPHOPRED_003476 [Cyphobasidiales sp. Tagirdzhanova-0007]
MQQAVSTGSLFLLAFAQLTRVLRLFAFSRPLSFHLIFRSGRLRIEIPDDIASRLTACHTKAQKAAAASSSGKGKKKKWSKGKVKDKAQNLIVLDKPTYDRIYKEVPTYKLISVSVLIDRMKIGGALARKAINTLEKEGLIKRVVHARSQFIYTRATAAE